jgi:hypothetical protein
MPKVKTVAPQPSRNKGQRSVDPLYLVRPYYNWNVPEWVNARYWKSAVQQQEICMNCREYHIGRFLSLDWKIEARDSEQQDELKEEVKYYTKFFTNTGDFDYSEIIEWVGADYLDLPFGSAVEVGRMGDEQDGRVVWLELLDGTTLFPTLNSDWPVGQYMPEGGQTPIYFPKHAIDRIYMSPRTDIKRKGWGMAPPEKIFMALNMISRGDLYYANLLLDTPEAGILDLIDMSKDSAEAWVDAWRKMLAGIDPYKIPILYEHTQSAQWIPFTRPPQELMFTEALSHYISIVTSGYGITAGDIGLPEMGGKTLAGSIRDDRKTNRNGFARTKRKLTEFFNKILPDTLRYKIIDLDDEMSVAMGRARLANATAFTAYSNAGIFSKGEIRRQTIADGLVSISVPEEIPQEVLDEQQQKQDQFNAERPSMLGRPVSPSQGGWGETAARSQFKSWLDGVRDIQDVYLQRLVFLAFPGVLAQLKGVISGLDDENLIYDWIINQNEALLFNDGEIYHPDQMDLSLVELLKSNVSSIGMIKTIYESQIQEDVSKLYFDVVKKVSDDWLNRNFIQEGELQHTGHDTLVSISDNVFNEIVSFTKGVDAVLPEIVAKSVVIGLRDYLVETKQQDQLEASYDPMCLAYVRSALGSALDGLFDGYKDRISGIIVKELENSLNG